MFALQNIELYTTFLKAFANNRDVQNTMVVIFSADGPLRYLFASINHASIWTKIKRKMLNGCNLYNQSILLLDECSWGFRHNGKIEDTWCDSIGSIGSVGLLPLHTNATGSGRAFPTDEILGQVQIHYGICKCDLFFSTVLCIPVLCTILQLFNIL